MTNPAFDLIGLTDLRNDPRYREIDGQFTTNDGERITVAVLDTGFAANHPFLDDSFAGYVDFVDGGGQFIDNIANTGDPNGHGTHVAGIIGSENPDIGVAPEANLIGLRVLGGTGSELQQALQWVLDNRSERNIVAVNMSLGVPTAFLTDPNQVTGTQFQVWADLISDLENAGVTVVSAAGNSYVANHNNNNQQNVSTPAISSTLAVGAVWQDGVNSEIQWGSGSIDLTTGSDQVTSFSQRLDFDKFILAPGAIIESTFPGGGVQGQAGTSQASPVVAGAVALLQDAALTFGGSLLSPDEVREILLATADTVFDGDDEHTNVTPTNLDYPRLNIHAAVQEVERRLTGNLPDNPVDPIDPGDPDPEDPTGTLGGALAVTFDSEGLFVDLGNLGVDGSATVGDTDVDLFRFEVGTSGSLVALTTGSDIDTIVRLFDAAGEEIAFNDDFDGLLSQISVDLLSGTYYLGVSGYPNIDYDPTTLNDGSRNAGSTGDYGLEISFLPGDVNGTIATAVSLEEDLGFQLGDLNVLTTVTPGTIGSDFGGNSGDNDVDIFSFDVPAGGGLVTIQTDEGSEFDSVDTILRLFDGNGQELAVDDDGGSGTFSSIEASLVEGTYYVGVSGFSNFNYSPFSSGSGISGSTGSYSLQFQFEGGNVVSGDPNGTIDTALDLGNLELVDADGDGNPEGPSGFPISIILGSDNQSGVSRLAVGSTDVDLLRFHLENEGIVLFETNDFSIDDGDPTTPIPGDADSNGRIDARNEFGGIPDTVLRLFNAQGEEIAVNDDGGEGLFSRIEEELTPGTYYLGVSGYDNSFYDPNVLDDSRIEGSNGIATLDIVFQPNDSDLDPDGIRRGANPVNLLLGGTTRFSGDIGLDGDLEVSDADVDLYEFTASSDGILLIDIDTPFGPEFGNDQVNADTVLALFDGDGVELQSSDDNLAVNFSGELVEEDTDGNSNSIVQDNFGVPVGHDLDSFISAEVIAGETYFIGVSGFGNSGYDIDNLDGRNSTDQFITGGSSYDLIVSYGGASAGVDTNGAINTGADSITLPFSQQGNIGEDQGSEVGPADVDFYRVTTNSAGILNIDIDAFEENPVANPVDSMVFLFDAQGNELAFNDDSTGDSTGTGTLDSSLQFNVQSNQDYFIAVTGYGNFYFNPNVAGSGGGGDTGDYILKVDLSVPEVGGNPRARLPTFLSEGTDSSLDLDLNVFQLFNDGGVLDLPEGVSFFNLDSNNPVFITGNLGEDVDAAADDDVTQRDRPAVRNAFGPVFLSESSGTSDSDVSVTVGDDDVDIYPIRVQSLDTYDLSLVDFAAQIGDFGANATLLLFDNTGEEVARSDTDSRLIETLAIGDYLLVVVPEGGADSFDVLNQSFTPTPEELQSFSQNTGDYTLRLEAFSLQNNNSPQADLGAFSLSLNSAVQLEELSLYDGPDSDDFDGASIIVTDPSGNPIRGSIVFDDETNEVIFIPTDPLQASGDFQITYSTDDLVAATDPAQSLNEDPSGTVDVSMDATAISVPSFARGPGQSVDIGASGAGLPISISDGLGIRDLDLSFEYDPSLLSVTDLLLGESLPAGWAIVDFTIATDQNGNETGLVTSDLSGPTSLQAGSVDLVRLVATVPETATFNDSQKLEVTAGAINPHNDPIAIEGSSAVHKVAFFGDTNANGVIDIFDVTNVFDLSRERITGFDSYDLTDPLLTSDTNVNGVIDIFDVTNVFDASRQRPLSAIPPISIDLDDLNSSVGPDSTIEVVSVTGDPGETVRVVVNITATEDPALRSLDLQITGLDPNVLDLDNAVVDLNNSFTQGLTETIDIPNNRVLLSGLTEALEGLDLTVLPVQLVTIDFPILDTAAPGSEVTLQVESGLGGASADLFNPDGTDLELTSVPGTITIADNGENPVNIDFEIDANNLVNRLVYDTTPAGVGTNVNTNLADDVLALGTDAVFDNLVGFYQITDINGGIDTNGDGVADLQPGDDGYARAAITNRVDDFSIRAGSSGDPTRNTTVEQFGDAILAGGNLYAPFVIANGGGLGFDGFVAAEDAETDGVFNDAADFIEDQVAYFSFVGSNPDGVKHLQSRGNNVFGFEDLPSNIFSDMDFNDAVFSFDFG